MLGPHCFILPTQSLGLLKQVEVYDEQSNPLFSFKLSLVESLICSSFTIHTNTSLLMHKPQKETESSCQSLGWTEHPTPTFAVGGWHQLGPLLSTLHWSLVILERCSSGWLIKHIMLHLSHLIRCWILSTYLFSGCWLFFLVTYQFAPCC